ncbi:clavaminate synthase-like protein [Phanerochaete sordida]|uniref:Clavaminate synthase-like protein n=1 Tax=Phanerochaete sordida TaxID=48140 RepID=A0A9P3LN60_9APHY|nr:clavaminate synthase-like protein [Phanerochaete sordida]
MHATVSSANHAVANDQEPPFTIPLIDFNKFMNASDSLEKHQTAEDIVRAFKEVGFIYLNNHGVPGIAISTVFDKSAAFFDLAADAKDKLKWVDPRANRGYVGVGRQRRATWQFSDAAEIAKMRAGGADLKESMEIGRDWDSPWENQWPDERDVPGFRQTMLAFYQTCHGLHVQVMRAVAVGLGLDETYFDERVDQQCHNLRLLSYPPVPTDVLAKDGQARIGAHSDYGTITLLFQDSTGGLEVLNPHTREFQPVTPIPGTIVVNVGDLLARWSNDLFRSTLHRVVEPPATQTSDGEAIIPLRRSVAFFCNPNFDAVIACLPNCGTEAKYPPVTTEQYVVGRLSATFGK